MIIQTRSDFYKTVNVNGISEKDLLLNNWEKFEITKPVSYYQITEREIQRPDLISASVYGDMSYWWLLLKHNEYISCFDLEAGSVLECPHIQDIQNFISLIS